VEIHQLRCFQVVVEEGGFKRATTRLHITQPALSYQVKQLEQELGESLFHRRPGGVSPTAAGRVLFQHVQEVMDAVRRAERAVQELSEGIGGEIRIGTVNSVGIYFLPQVLWSMRSKFPHARPKVLYKDSNDIMEALLSNDLDIAIVSDPRPDRRLRQEALIEERVSMVCGRSSAFFGRKHVKPGELKGIQFVALSPDTPTGAAVCKYLARLGISVEPVVTTDNVETVKKMVEVGLGVAFLPDMVTSLDIACEGGPRGSLARVEVEPVLSRKIMMVTWRHFESGRALDAFVETLRHHACEWRACVEPGPM
jgi:DNA-binding transcriptional LysR family regulator